VERMLSPDVDVGAVELDDVVTGSSVTPQPQRRNGSRVDDEEILEPPRVGDVLVPRQDEVHVRSQQALDRVAGVVDDVPLASRTRYGKQVVVKDEDPEDARLGGELGLDPRVAAAADLPVVEVGLGRVDGDDRDTFLAENRVAAAEHLLE